MTAQGYRNSVGKWGLVPASLNRKKNKQIEHNFQKGIIKELIFRGYDVIRLNSGAFKTESGTYVRAYKFENLNMSSGLADLQVIKKGRIAFIEIKSDEKKKLSRDQQELSDYFNERGTPYFKVGSVEELNNCLKLLEA